MGLDKLQEGYEAMHKTKESPERCGSGDRETVFQDLQTLEGQIKKLSEMTQELREQLNPISVDTPIRPSTDAPYDIDGTRSHISNLVRGMSGEMYSLIREVSYMKDNLDL